MSEKKGCEYCKGRAYTKKPLTVITRYGRRIELTFEFCPKCGRKLNTEKKVLTMPEYIEREAVLKKIDTAIGEYAQHGEIVRFIGDCRASVIYALAADVVEVVRCSECKHHHDPMRCALWYGTLGDNEYFLEHGKDFYCAFGERRSENENT